ncbi:MAG: exodeoxyribonuclease VII large subunit, partial [Bacteroidales bacterium]
MSKDFFSDFTRAADESSQPKSLFELNNMLRRGIREYFPENLWVQAEIAECKENASGHCYLEL